VIGGISFFLLSRPVLQGWGVFLVWLRGRIEVEAILMARVGEVGVFLHGAA